MLVVVSAPPRGLSAEPNPVEPADKAKNAMPGFVAIASRNVINPEMPGNVGLTHYPPNRRRLVSVFLEDWHQLLQAVEVVEKFIPPHKLPVPIIKEAVATHQVVKVRDVC